MFLIRCANFHFVPDEVSNAYPHRSLMVLLLFLLPPPAACTGVDGG